MWPFRLQVRVGRGRSTHLCLGMRRYTASSPAPSRPGHASRPATPESSRWARRRPGGASGGAPGAGPARAAAPRRWIIAAGTAVACLSAAPGLAWAVEGRPAAWPLLAAAAGTGILNAAAAMYEAWQETRRAEIASRSTDMLAGALARCLDDAHARARNLPATQEIQEAARIRASARELLTDVLPPVAAILGHPESGQPPETGRP